MTELDDLGSIIDAETPMTLVVDEAATTARMELGFGPSEPGSRQRGRGVVVELLSVSRITARLLRVDAKSEIGRASWRRDAFGERLAIADAAELNHWLSQLTHLRDPRYPMFDQADPAWMSAVSIDHVWSGRFRHTADFSFGTTSLAPDHTMTFRVWFDDLRLLTPRGSEVELEYVVAEVRYRREWERAFASRTVHRRRWLGTRHA